MVEYRINRILIIESNTHFRNTLKNFLQSQFPTVAFEEVQNGAEALQKATYFCPDIIFMGIKLSTETAVINRTIRNLFPKVTIVFFADYDSNEYRDAAKESGADYILQKGASTAEEIEGLVHSILNSTRSSRIKGS